MSYITDTVIDSMYTDGHGFSLESSERSDWRQDRYGNVELSHLECVESWDRDQEQAELLSQEQLDSLSSYLSVALTGDVSADCDALIDALREAKGPGARMARAGIWATLRAGRLYDGVLDGADLNSIGNVDGVTEPEGYAHDRERHTASYRGERDTLGDAMELAASMGLSEGRKLCKQARIERTRRLWDYIEREGRAFYALALQNRWSETSTHADRIKRAAEGIRARYLASVAECRESGQWHRLYLTKAQYQALRALVSGAFRAVKYRPGAVPKDLI